MIFRWMRWHKAVIIVFAATVLFAFVACTPHRIYQPTPPPLKQTPSPSMPTTTPPALLGTFVADQVIRQPIIAGKYLFWISVQPNKSVRGYDISQKREFLIASPSSVEDIYSLASDGTTVVWTEAYQRIRGYDLSTSKEFTIANVSYPRAIGDAGGLPSIALENGILYYADAIANPTGGWDEGSIYSHSLTTGVETKLVEHGHRPVVKDGVLLWSYRTATPEMELHALRLDGSMGDTVLSTGLVLQYFSGYDVSGDNVVWAGFGSEAGVYLYNLKTGTRTQLPSPGGHNPLIDGNKVLWTEEPSGGFTGGAVTDWSIKVYDTVSGKLSLVTKEHSEWAQAVGMTEQGSISYTKGQVYRELYLISPTP